MLFSFSFVLSWKSFWTFIVSIGLLNLAEKSYLAPYVLVKMEKKSFRGQYLSESKKAVSTWAPLGEPIGYLEEPYLMNADWSET